jgi:hypothetical protein
MKHLMIFETYGNIDGIEDVAKDIYKTHISKKAYDDVEKTEGASFLIIFDNNSKVSKKIKKMLHTDKNINLRIKITKKKDPYISRAHCQSYPHEETYFIIIEFNTLKNFTINSIVHELRHAVDNFYTKTLETDIYSHINMPIKVFVKMEYANTKYDKALLLALYVICVKEETTAYYSQSIEEIKRNVNKYDDYISLAENTSLIKNAGKLLKQKDLNLDKDLLTDMYNQGYYFYCAQKKIAKIKTKIKTKEQFIIDINKELKRCFDFAKKLYYRLFQIAKDEFDKI